MTVSWDLYLALSAAMFLEYAIWGAWAPVLAARLLGPLKMSGKQTGWIYATLPLACIYAPLISGALADAYLPIKWILAGCQLATGVFLLAAANIRTFWPLFWVMLAQSTFYAATLPLVNAILFVNVKDAGTQALVFLWAPVAWALIGYVLTGWRWVFKTEREGRDCLIFGGVLAIVMALVCAAFLPTNEPARTGEVPILAALSKLESADFLLFFIVSLAAAGMMQFYFLGSARFMQDIGIAAQNVPGIMAIAQAVQALATWFLLGTVVKPEVLGYKWTLVVGLLSWLVLYIVYILGKPRLLVAVIQAFHGLAYVFFMIAGQMYANAVAEEAIRSSMQALIFVATTGVGLFLGTQLAGAVMDRAKVGEQFVWRRVWIVPAAILAICLVAMAVVFKGQVAG
ncbi:MAG: MFS transporter [Thermoguttaceae bacterium]|nr:MFS transporter [Thermoguttaceae bacterium]MDW8077934.1 MFS transporter [Thermoguttaceae bacterium]